MAFLRPIWNTLGGGRNEAGLVEVLLLKTFFMIQRLVRAI